MKYVNCAIAAISVLAASQVNAELPFKLQLSADAYLYDVEEVYDDNLAVENAEYDGELFGATLKLTPVSDDIKLSGDISFRTGSLDGDYTEFNGGFANGSLDVDRDEIELRAFYNLTDSIFVTASWIYISADTEGKEDGSAYEFEVDNDYHIFPIGFGFTTTEKLGEWYISPKASISYALGSADSDYSDNLAFKSSSDESLDGFIADVTVIFDRPLSEDSSFFAEIGWKYWDLDAGDQSLDLSGLYGRLGYRWSF